MTLRTAERHYTTQARLGALVSRRMAAMWRDVPPGNINAWRQARPQAAAVVAAGQYRSARAAEPYIADALAEQGSQVRPDARVNPAGFAGQANDGRPLATLLDQPRITALSLIGDGEEPPSALARAGRQLQMLAVAQVQDAGRQADQVGIFVRPRTGWVRMVSPPCCERCAILAGKWFRSNEGFLRHPRCDCRHIPAAEDHPGDIATDSQALFDSGQVRGLSETEKQAIQDGADPAQVVNAQRIRKGGRKVGMTTSEGGPGGRLTPDGIYRTARSRDEALALLSAHGYTI